MHPPIQRINAHQQTIKFPARSGDLTGTQIAELTLAMKMEAKTEDVTDTIHAHPTLTEPVRETALKLKGRPVHIT